jgi:hypothetical protein
MRLVKSLSEADYVEGKDVAIEYRWAEGAARFAEVVVAPRPDEEWWRARQRWRSSLGRDIRVRIAATAPKELASAIIKAVVAR